MTEQETKRTLVEIANDIAEQFVREGLSPREVLFVLRELENDAVLAHLFEHIVKKESDDSGAAIAEQKSGE